MTLKAKVEAVVYAAEEPVTLAQLAGIFADEVLEELATENPEPFSQGTLPGVIAEENTVSPAEESPAPETDEKKAARRRDRLIRQELERILNQLIAEYADGQRGMEIREIAGGYRMATKPEYHDAVRGFVKNLKPPMKLSLQALETLAVIAYKQPVTGPEVSEIRGVDSGGVLGSLIGRKLITTAGRKQVIGRPILYKTTKEFLLRFGLKDVNELPSMEEFEKMAGELAESEAEAEDAAMRSGDESAAPMPQPGVEETEEPDEAGEPGEENALALNIPPSPPEAQEPTEPPAEEDRDEAAAKS